jgi:hypothetical protein
MTDYCLRFPDEATSFAAAQELGAVVETEDGPRLARFTHRYAIDVIGEIPEVTGWHVNLRILDGTSLPEDLQQYVVTPENPYRVWA